MESKNIKLLLVEDDQADAFLISEMLSQETDFRIEIQRAQDLRSATDNLVSSSFDILLTDLGLPDSQGMATLKTILEFAKGTPVIVLTGLDDIEKGYQSISIGAQDYLLKGDFDHSKLFRSIRYAISRTRVEEDLKASEIRMRALFENGPDAYLVLDLYGKIKDANRFTEKLFGLTRSEFLGRNLARLNLFPGEQRLKLKKAMAHLSLGMAIGPEEYTIKCKSGREVYIEFRFFPVKTNEDIAIFASATNITEKKLISEKEKRNSENLQILAESSMKMIQFSRSEEVIDYLGEQLLDLIGNKAIIAIFEASEELDYFKMRSVKGKAKYIGFIEKTLNKKVLSLNGVIGPIIKNLIGSPTLKKIEEDLITLAGGILNKSPVKIIGKFLDLQDFYFMSMVRGDNMYAHLVILNNSSLDRVEIKLFETMINKASIVMERISYQEALHESEERYKVLFDNSPQGIAVIGSEDRIITWNRHALDLLGINDNESWDLNIPEFYKDVRDRDRLYKIFREKGNVRNFEVELVRRNGTSFHANISMVPITYEGELARMVVINDISSRKYAEEERKILYKAIEQSPSMVMITDAKGIIQYVNPSFCSTTGFSEAEVIGNSPAIFNSDTTSKRTYSEMWDTVLSGNSWKGKVQNKSKDGNQFWSNLEVFPINDENGTLSHIVAIIVDLSETMKTGEDLERAKVKAKESDQLKSAFLANMSHEIRTPMNAIVGFSQLLSSPDHNEDKKREFVEIIQSRSEDLMKIIENLVDVSKIESGQILTSISAIEVQKLVSRVYEKFQDHVKPKVNFYLKIPDELKNLRIYSDPAHLTRILENLVDNAIKFTDEGAITLGFKGDGDDCILYVEDTGIGIHKSKDSIIFNRFIQAEIFDPGARGGNGLGLTIAKDLTEILDGKVWFESERGKGSTFYVSMPLHKNPASQINSLLGYTHESGLDWSQKTILVAEDDISNFMVIKHFLISSNVNLRHVSNGMLAVEEYKNNGDFDLILMDMKMPLMNGYEATRIIRSINREIPIVALTASTSNNSFEDCLISGCNEALGKPLMHGELIQTIKRYFEIQN